MSRILFGYGLVILAAAACAAPSNNGERLPSASGASNAQEDVATQQPGAQPQEPAQLAPTDASATSSQSSDRSAIQATFDKIWAEPKFQRALAESYLRGSEVEPQLTQREAQSRLEVLTLINEQRLEDAVDRLQTLQGDNAVFDYMLGNIFFGQAKYADAAVAYTMAVDRMSNYRRAWQNLALSQMRNDQFAAARDAFVRVISLGGASPQTYGLLGIMHAQLGDYVAAESALRMVMMMEPDKESWRMMLAQAMFQQARYAESASLVGNLLQQNPDRVELWSLQANAYVGMQETKKAAENLEIVAELGGATYDSLNLLGNIYFNDEVFDLAVDAYIGAMAMGKDKSHRPMLDIASRLAARSAYSESRRLAKGIEDVYGEQLDIGARTELRKMRARLAASAGATEEQVALLQQIVIENPLDGDALIQLGRHFQEAGDAEAAILRFEQAARNEEFRAEAKVLHAQLLVSQDRFADALPLLREAQGVKRRDDVGKLLEFVERAASRGK